MLILGPPSLKSYNRTDISRYVLDVVWLSGISFEKQRRDRTFNFDTGKTSLILQNFQNQPSQMPEKLTVSKVK